VAVIVPAFEEAATVAGVVAVVRRHPAVAEVVVVDDGSRDDTAARARAAGARVLRQAENRGKAQAMERGVAATTAPLLLFVDADIVGLRTEVLDELVDEATRGGKDMFIAMVARKRFAGWLGHVLPVLGGTRILPRELWAALPPRYKRGFRIEIALNHFAARAGLIAGHRMIPGLAHVIKERKRGFWVGLRQRLGMIGDIVTAILCLYVWDRWTAGARVLAAMGSLAAAPQPPLRFPAPATASDSGGRAAQPPSPSRRSRR
jgi:glycosyltransferase involved in cell wall biosynthesis